MALVDAIACTGIVLKYLPRPPDESWTHYFVYLHLAVLLNGYLVFLQLGHYSGRAGIQECSFLKHYLHNWVPS